MTVTRDIDDVAGWIEVLRRATAEKQRADEVIAQARERIEEALGDAEVGAVAGTPAVRWTWVESTRIDTKRVRALLAPDDLAAVTVTSASRRFTLVDGDSA